MIENVGKKRGRKNKAELEAIANQKETIQEVAEIMKEIVTIPYSVEGKLLHIRVGDASFPAGDAEINKIKEIIEELLEENGVHCMVFVTHHAVGVTAI
jgi:hypothetical protein